MAAPFRAPGAMMIFQVCLDKVMSPPSSLQVRREGSSIPCNVPRFVQQSDRQSSETHHNGGS